MKKKISRVKLLGWTLLPLLFFILILKGFFIDAFKIPTGSMKNTLIEGDFVLLNSFAYNLKTPSTIPFTNYPIPNVNLISFSKPSAGDVVVFKYPPISEAMDSGAIQYYVKRVVGLPGSVVTIKNKEVFIDDHKISFPDECIVDKSNINNSGRIDDRIFPSGYRWNSDNYGPIRVPAKGDTIKIDSRTIKNWVMLVSIEQGQGSVSVEGTVVNINNRPVREYIVEKDYYFVLGDNRDDSLDSRYIGFIPEDVIEGRVSMIYWSVKDDSTKNFPSNIRFNRVLKSVH